MVDRNPENPVYLSQVANSQIMETAMKTLENQCNVYSKLIPVASKNVEEIDQTLEEKCQRLESECERIRQQIREQEKNAGNSKKMPTTLEDYNFLKLKVEKRKLERLQEIDFIKERNTREINRIRLQHDRVFSNITAKIKETLAAVQSLLDENAQLRIIIDKQEVLQHDQAESNNNSPVHATNPGNLRPNINRANRVQQEDNITRDENVTSDNMNNLNLLLHIASAAYGNNESRMCQEAPIQSDELSSTTLYPDLPDNEDLLEQTINDAMNFSLASQEQLEGAASNIVESSSLPNIPVYSCSGNANVHHADHDDPLLHHQAERFQDYWDADDFVKYQHKYLHKNQQTNVPFVSSSKSLEPPTSNAQYDVDMSRLSTPSPLKIKRISNNCLERRADAQNKENVSTSNQRKPRRMRKLLNESMQNAQEPDISQK